MKLSFRWYGADDPVSLEYISQIPGMRSVVSAVYDVKPGGVWSRESLAAIAEACRSHGLVFDVVESIPVHEDIKLGRPDADSLIDKGLCQRRHVARPQHAAVLGYCRRKNGVKVNAFFVNNFAHFQCSVHIVSIDRDYRNIRGNYFYTICLEPLSRIRRDVRKIVYDFRVFFEISQRRKSRSTG